MSATDFFRSPAVRIALVVTLAFTGCRSQVPPETFTLTTLNDSGVTGTVTLEETGGGKTRVTVEVRHGGNTDMPAHVHPGNCQDLVPQPKFPLQNVRDGRSVTDVPASIMELTAGTLAINLHRSVDDLATYTACADLR